MGGSQGAYPPRGSYGGAPMGYMHPHQGPYGLPQQNMYAQPYGGRGMYPPPGGHGGYVPPPLGQWLLLQGEGRSKIEGKELTKGAVDSLPTSSPVWLRRPASATADATTAATAATAAAAASTAADTGRSRLLADSLG